MDELQDLFYDALMRILGFDPDAAYSPNNPPAVRKSWPTEGQPDWGFNQDVLFIQPTLVDHDISQPLDEEWESHDADLLRRQFQTRVVRLGLVAYGPNAVEHLYMIRTALYNGMKSLTDKKLFVVPGPESVHFNPELFQARWWRRADLALTFNWGVEYKSVVKTIEHVPVASISANAEGASTRVTTQDRFMVNKKNK